MSGRQSTKEQKELQDQQHRNQSQLSAQHMGQQMQQDQLRSLLQNTKVVEDLLDADLSTDEPWIQELMGEHLHRDEVLSIHNRDDIHRKNWNNKIWTELVTMTFPPSESRSPDARVNEVQRRIHGRDQVPLTPRQKNSIRSKMEQKSDRGKRAAGGEFLELLLTSVVQVDEKSSTDDSEPSGGLLSGLVGGR